VPCARVVRRLLELRSEQVRLEEVPGSLVGSPVDLKLRSLDALGDE
jgi:hypothetical protein